VSADLFLAFPPGSRAAFLPRRVSWPPAPQSWNDLQARVESDQRALAALKPEGREGRALFAVRFLRPLLETIALVFTAIGLAAGWMGWPLAGLVLLSTAVMGMLTSLTALVLREFADPASEPAQLATLFRAAIVENLGYRQIRNLWLIRTWLR
jgi:arginine/ornithine N-succinyltransferase beta subunit